MRWVLILFLLIPSIGFANDEPLFSLEIENNNLFLCVHETPGDVESIILVLKGGKRVKINPAESTKCNSVLFLDAKSAFQVKSKGIKYLIYKDPQGNSVKVSVSSRQNQALVSSLP